MSPSPPRPSLPPPRLPRLRWHLCPPRAPPKSSSAVCCVQCHPIEGGRPRAAKRWDSNQSLGNRGSLSGTAWTTPTPISCHRCRHFRRPKQRYRCRSRRLLPDPGRSPPPCGTMPRTTGQSPASWARCPDRARGTRWLESRPRARQQSRRSPHVAYRRRRGGATGPPGTDRTAWRTSPCGTASARRRGAARVRSSCRLLVLLLLLLAQRGWHKQHWWWWWHCSY
mmetsp:Transcript_28825/g.83636  ORF Transcript_28825/g.83636 Transcript_28825/m.83636 type:complete len:224 (-) Transcript_28825:74-745(-)